MAQTAPTMQEPNQYSSVEKTQNQANDMLGQHIPGHLQKNNFGIQPAAVNTHGTEWTNSFWGCFAPPELCLMGWCCPCFLFGRTQSRMRGVRDPDLFSVNVDCAAWCGLYLVGGWFWVLQTMKRVDMRQRLGIEGSGVTDCLASCCCACCALVQEEKESLLKQEAIDAKSGQYNAPTGMAYP